MPRTGLIEAVLDMPDHLAVPAGRDAVRVDVLVQLRNRSEHDVVLAEDAPEDVHRWHLLDADHREVHRGSPGRRLARPRGTEPATSLLIGSGLSVSVPVTVQLPTAALEPGRAYTLRYRHWSHPAEATFVVVATPPAGATKSPRRRSATKKRSSKGKSASARSGKTRKKRARKQKARAGTAGGRRRRGGAR